MQGHKNYQEKLFTNFRLSDRVPENNFYRRLNKELDLSFLYKSTEKYYGKEGQASIDPVVFFKLLLTGYFENVQSDRRIIENARLRLDILYYIGYDIDEELPWHSTLSRTRQLFGEEVFRAFFQQILLLCIDKGMVAGKRQAIDSAFVKANASMQSLRNKEILQDGNDFIASLDESAKEEAPVKKIPPKDTRGNNRTRYSPSDPDARISQKPGKPNKMNYLGQVSVDTAHHVITNIEAHHADKRDSECLKDIVAHTAENLACGGLEVKEIVADGNYAGTEAFKAVKEMDITAYIPDFGSYKPVREGFTYHAEGDYYQCRHGSILPFKKVYGKGQKQYRSLTADCRGCPFKTTCLGEVKKYKTINDSVDKHLLDEMHYRMQTKYAQEMKRLRQSRAEPVLGTLINEMAMKKVNTKGLKQAHKCMVTAAVAYNLKKFMKWEAKKRPTVACLIKNVVPALSVNQFLHLLEAELNTLWHNLRTS